MELDRHHVWGTGRRLRHLAVILQLCSLALAHMDQGLYECEQMDQAKNSTNLFLQVN